MVLYSILSLFDRHYFVKPYGIDVTFVQYLILRVILLRNMTKKKILQEKKRHRVKLKRMRWINILKSLRCFG